MRIAVVHSFYRSDQPSGENTMVLEQVKALSEAGHEALLVARHSDEESRRMGFRVRSTIRVATGTGPDPTAELARFRPDVVHVHNLFPNFGRRWAAHASAPIVATLHNFRSLCANGLLFRDGRTCLDCVTGSVRSAVAHRCYRDSLAATLPLAIQASRGISGDPLYARAAALICLSESAREVFQFSGADPERLVVIPNGIKDPGLTAAAEPNGRWLFAGRLSSEKGALDLVRAWPREAQLDIVGDGPEAHAHRAIAGPNVQYLGVLDRAHLLSCMTQYEGLIFPSACLEMQPTVVIEGMSMGLPIVARTGNAGARLVEDWRCGATYEDASTLAASLEAVQQDRANIGPRGRDAFGRMFNQESWVNNQLALYERVVGN